VDLDPVSEGIREKFMIEVDEELSEAEAEV
jgi:hypothetical protein